MVQRICVVCKKSFNAKTQGQTCSKSCDRIRLNEYQKQYKKQKYKTDIVNRQKINKRNLGYYHKHKKEVLSKGRIRFRELRIRNRNFLLENIGDKCIICGKPEFLVFHEIYGKPHGNLSGNFVYIKKNYKDFIPLCRGHHVALHIFHKTINKQKFLELIKMFNKD